MNNIDEAIHKFKNGKIGIFPTDTAFGIGCRMDDKDAVKKVFEIRNRPSEKAVLVLVSSIKMAEEYVEEIPYDVREKLLSKYWPGGLTVILKCRKDKVMPIVRSNGETLAIRLPDSRKLLEIIEKVGVPIIAPSANISGGKTPLTLDEVSKELQSRVDFVLSGSCTIKGVSTIVDCSKKPWEIVREGVVELADSL